MPLFKRLKLHIAIKRLRKAFLMPFPCKWNVFWIRFTEQIERSVNEGR